MSGAQSNTIPAPTATLVRIPACFAHLAPEVLHHALATTHTRPGPEYYLCSRNTQADFTDPATARFLRWRMPVHHAWPCNPREMERFVEKSALTLARKFAHLPLQSLRTGLLDPGSPDPWFRRLASNLRGRTLQLFPPLPAADATTQDPTQPTLFCLLGRHGLFCGVGSPRDCLGFHPGGTRFIAQHTPETISRAGAKLAEALHFLTLHTDPPAPGAHWLELGASPGGMTAELLHRGFNVTAIDRAPLAPRLANHPHLTFIHADVSRFAPATGIRYDAILCDMNGSPTDAIRHVTRLTPALAPGGCVIFTLKTTGAESFAAITQLANEVTAIAAAHHLTCTAQTHLSYNRREFTLVFHNTSR